MKVELEEHGILCANIPGMETGGGTAQQQRLTDDLRRGQTWPVNSDAHFIRKRFPYFLFL